MYRQGNSQLLNVAAKKRSRPLVLRVRRALAIAMAALVLGTVAAPASATLAIGKPDSGAGVVRPLDGVGDSPVMP
jgi:hypothetical protein